MDVTKFRWYKFDGVRTVVFDKANKDYDLEIEKGEVFGIRLEKSKVHVLHKDDPTILFKVEPKLIKRVIDKSNGFRGKVGKVKVSPGMQGKDMKKHSKPKGSAPKHTMPSADVSPMIEDKALTRKLKAVKFPGLKFAEWVFTQPDTDGVTPVHFYDVAKTLVNYRRKHKLPVNKEGDWADELAATVENSIAGKYCEAGTVKHGGKLVKILAVTDDL